MYENFNEPILIIFPYLLSLFTCTPMVVKRDLSTAIKVPRSREAIQFISCQWPINNSRQETELRRAFKATLKLNRLIIYK